MNSVAEFGMQFNPSFFIRMDADDISEEKTAFYVKSPTLKAQQYFCTRISANRS